MELMRHVTVGQYVPGDSPAHRVDPRVKLLLLILGMTVAFSLQSPLSIAWLLVLCLAAAATARLPIGYLLGGIWNIRYLLALTVLFNLFCARGGPPVATLGRFSIHREGEHLAFLMGARLSLLMLMTSLLTLTTSPIRLTDALEKILSPFARIGVPAAEIAMMMSIALRFIPTLVETAERIMKAQAARGARFDEGNALQRTRALVPVLVPLFVHAFHAAEELAVAMEARCYRGGAGRTRMVSLSIRGLDVAAVLLVGIALAAPAWLEAWPWR